MIPAVRCPACGFEGILDHEIAPLPRCIGGHAFARAVGVRPPSPADLPPTELRPRPGEESPTRLRL